MATGIDVSVDGKVIKGATGYSVSEESTPVDVTDTTGATGRFTVSFWKNLTTSAIKRMRGKVVDLQDQGQGTTQGTAKLPSYANGAVSLTSDSRLNLLAVQRTAQPFSGTLGNYFQYLLGLVGITSGFVIDDSLDDLPVTYQGFQGDVWLYIKKMLPTVNAEVSLVSDNIVLRPLRGRITVDKRDTDYSWNQDDSGLALSVEGYYYDNHYETSALAYPTGGWNEDVQVYQVDAGETIEFDIPISASLLSVDQPVAQDNVLREEESASVYCVMANDGLPIPAAMWNDQGGSITVAIGEDTKSLVVTIKGMSDPTGEYAPYRIAATAGPSDNYSSLRILGEGVFFTKTLLTFPTGVSPDATSVEVGATIDSEYISTLEQLYDAVLWPLARYGGARSTMTVTTRGINRQGDAGSYAYPTIQDFNDFADGLGWNDIADFNAYYSGKTIQEFNDEWYATVASAFVNQAFGNVAGARTFREWMWWRIRQATITPEQIQYVAEADTTVGDFNDAWTGKNIDDFNDYWSTKTGGWGKDEAATISDFNVAPLERVL